MPPSVTSATTCAAGERLDQLGRAPLLVALEVGDDPAADGDAEVAGQPGAAGGCPRRRPRRRWPAPRAAGPRRRRGCPAARRAAPGAQLGHFTHAIAPSSTRVPASGTTGATGHRGSLRSRGDECVDSRDRAPTRTPTGGRARTGAGRTERAAARCRRASGAGSATVDARLRPRARGWPPAVVVAIAAILRLVGPGQPEGQDLRRGRTTPPTR